jgi:hypothetical protein
VRHLLQLKVLQVALVVLHNRLVAVEAVLVWQVLQEAMPQLLVMAVTDYRRL